MKKLIIIVLTVSVIFANGNAQEVINLPSIFDFLEEQVTNDYLELTISADFSSLIEKKNEDTEYYPAILEFRDQNNEIISWDLKLKARGKFRRMNCDFPPLKLNFSKSDLAEAGFTNFDKYKLVSHCIDDPFEAKDNLFREQLAYQFHNVITPLSFRSILLRVKYVDTSKSLSNFTRYALLLESKDELAHRLNLERTDDLFVPQLNQIDKSAEVSLSLFQYMIGNTDYNIHMVRNMNWYKDNTTGRYVPIGYDYDFTGIVRPRYMKLNSNIGQTSIDERFYLGLPAENEVFQAQFSFISNQKEEIINLVRDFRRLQGSSKREILDYLEVFFTDISMYSDNRGETIYDKLRAFAPNAIPPGANPEEYEFFPSQIGK